MTYPVPGDGVRAPNADDGQRRDSAVAMSVQPPAASQTIHPAVAGALAGFLGCLPSVALTFGGIQAVAGLNANGGAGYAGLFSGFVIMLGTLGGAIQGAIWGRTSRPARAHLLKRILIGGLRGLVIETFRGALGGAIVGGLLGWFVLFGGFFGGAMYVAVLGAAAGCAYGSWWGAVNAAIEGKSDSR